MKAVALAISRRLSANRRRCYSRRLLWIFNGANNRLVQAEQSRQSVTLKAAEKVNVRIQWDANGFQMSQRGGHLASFSLQCQPSPIIKRHLQLHFLPARAAADELHHRLPAQRTELKPATAKGSRTPQGAVLRRHWTPAPDPFVQQNIDVNGDLRGQHQIALRHVDHRTPHIAF
ncbi:hypothetical protein GQR58_030720 [Nymphon striatum]|nr:hypothetical protein GQR58_030720 [Nymphon striatum]